MSTSTTAKKEPSETASPITWKLWARVVVGTLILPVIMFLAAGRLDWWMAWVFSGIALVISVSSRVILAHKDPTLLTEREQGAEGEGVKSWDKAIVPVVALLGPMATLILAGLDFRFGWSPRIALAAQLVAALVMALGNTLGVWAMIVNRFFGGYVRIQTDRGHTVVSEGPYRAVRHPGYIGGVLTWLSTPLMLGSLWAYIPAVVTAVLYIVRTALEDKTLQAELPGYKEYAQQTRYRLIPGIW